MSPPPALVDFTTPDGTSFSIPDPTMDQSHFWQQMARATGSPHPEVHVRLLDELNRVLGRKSDAVTSALATIVDIAPRDSVEGMLAVQMVCLHRLAMDLLASTATPGQTLEIATFRFNQATRLMRLYSAHADCLSRQRGKAPTEQRVIVEHVHIHGGAQAIAVTVAAVGPDNPPPSPSPCSEEAWSAPW